MMCPAKANSSNCLLEKYAVTAVCLCFWPVVSGGQCRAAAGHHEETKPDYLNRLALCQLPMIPSADVRNNVRVFFVSGSKTGFKSCAQRSEWQCCTSYKIIKEYSFI